MDGDQMGQAKEGAGGADVSVVICGQAGQGVQTVEYLLTRVLKLAGYHVFATKEYMSRVRGGANSTSIRVSSSPVQAYVARMDILVALNKGAVEHVSERFTDETVVLAEKEHIGDVSLPEGCKYFDVAFEQIASDIGKKIYSNVVAVGALTAVLGVDLDAVTEYVKRYFASKSDEIVESNVEAAKAGYEAVDRLDIPAEFKLEGSGAADVKDRLLLSGGEAVGLGAIAGGCRFISAYPMSPSTAVLVFLAEHGREFGVLAEQAEDEIAAINMAVGAWYAGARAMITTSGGGFALMTEGVSLAAMLETPVVAHVAQRPGPATGLPTRTEQGDLELVLYAGHGEFPRVIFAPGTLAEAFELTQKAFNLADRYQIPVFILTDQYLVDSYYDMPGLDLGSVRVQHHVAKTPKDYRRYELVEGGISPRGIPGHGQGLVVVDSDEHDEEGHITEDLNLRVQMVDKRLAKGQGLTDEIVPPELLGPEDYTNLVICWGSTYHVVKEGLEMLGRDDTAMLHYKQVYPLHPDTAGYIEKAKTSIVVESNATGQFRKLIRLHAATDTDEGIVKYDGLSFAVEDIVEALGELLS
jgi:2-oxoglutarate ferredoxin oxidoreductase subunit alpha